MSQYLSFSPESSAMVSTVATFVISFTTIVAIIYEKLKLTIFIMFISAAVFFELIYFIKQSVINTIFLVIALMVFGVIISLPYKQNNDYLT